MTSTAMLFCRKYQLSILLLISCNSDSITISMSFIIAYKSVIVKTPALPHYTQCKRLLDFVVIC